MADTTNTHIPTIVYVEDNAGDAVLLEEALREGGHAAQLLVIEKGDKALRYFEIKEQARDLPPPHCILLDAHLPIVTGAQLLRFIRASRVYDDTPVYIFAAEAEYRDILNADIVSKESFLTKSSSWDGFLELAKLLMRSATAKQDNTIASASDSGPEVHAEGDLRRQETKEQRARASNGSRRLSAKQVVK
jgi:CheY-like chemotaxis protein